MIIDKPAIMALAPIRGPRPNIRLPFEGLVDKLVTEEQGAKRGEFTPDVALAVLDYWIGALLLTRSYIQCHAAVGRDFDLTKRG